MEESYYKIDRRIHEVSVVIATSEQEAKEKLKEDDYMTSEIWDDRMEVIDKWED